MGCRTCQKLRLHSDLVDFRLRHMDQQLANLVLHDALSLAFFFQVVYLHHVLVRI